MLYVGHSSFCLRREHLYAFPGQVQEGKQCSTFQVPKFTPKYGDVVLQPPQCNALLHRIKVLGAYNTSLSTKTPMRNPKQITQCISQTPKDGSVSEHYVYLCVVWLVLHVVLIMVKNQLNCDSAIQ